MIDKAICAKCMVYCLRSTMRLIRMGKSRRLVCQACAAKQAPSWFGGKRS